MIMMAMPSMNMPRMSRITLTISRMTHGSSETVNSCSITLIGDLLLDQHPAENRGARDDEHHLRGLPAGVPAGSPARSDQAQLAIIEEPERKRIERGDHRGLGRREMPSRMPPMMMTGVMIAGSASAAMHSASRRRRPALAARQVEALGAQHDRDHHGAAHQTARARCRRETARRPRLRPGCRR